MYSQFVTAGVHAVNPCLLQTMETAEGVLPGQRSSLPGMDYILK